MSGRVSGPGFVEVDGVSELCRACAEPARAALALLLLLLPLRLSAEDASAISSTELEPRSVGACADAEGTEEAAAEAAVAAAAAAAAAAEEGMTPGADDGR